MRSRWPLALAVLAAVAAGGGAVYVIWLLLANHDCAPFWTYPLGCPAADRIAATFYIIAGTGVGTLAGIGVFRIQDTVQRRRARGPQS